MKEIFKIAFKSWVDLPMCLIIVIIGTYNIFHPMRGGIIFFGVYTFWVLFRLAWWKKSADKFVTDPQFRKMLRLPDRTK